MQVKKLLSLFAALLMWCAVDAQDIHFTQYYMSPLTINPAQTGQFAGTIRLGGIYRNQYASLIRDEFSTPSAFVDSPVLPGFRKKDWIGAGLGFFTDKAGSSQLKRSSFALSGAYPGCFSERGLWKNQER